VTDLLEQTKAVLHKERIQSLADVRGANKALVGPSRDVLALKAELEAFLRERVYQHYKVLRMGFKGQRILHRLFDEYRRHPSQLPDRYFERVQRGALEQTICDYIAGMTDRFAQDEYLRLFQPYVLV
jgi:dGTPase